MRYADAVRLLGGASPAIKAADTLLGGALTIATAGGSDAALGLFDAKAEVIRLGHVVAGKVHDSVRGQARHDRSSRLQAAHGILVVSSFFEAVDEIIAATELDPPELTRDDQVLLVAGTPITGDWLRDLLGAPVPVPSAERSAVGLLDDLRDWYLREALHFGTYLQGLAAWERADQRSRRAVQRLLSEVLPAAALRRYEDSRRALAIDVPEFGLWVRRAEDRAVGRSLIELQEVLERTTSARDPDRRRRALAAAYRVELDKPVTGEASPELMIPALGEAYLDPLFRVKAAGPTARPAEHSWWDADIRSDFAAFLAEHLTTPQAAEAPLLLLGQPGAGKSALTRVLAARLPAADYLVVRVALREVPAEAEIQDQIEQAIRTTIGETVAWADLAATADGALPVIMLDGFDELLQATGVHQSDYLQRVARFQEREAVQGRPVAVIVTSRVAVADRARLPDGTLIARLEGFDDARVARWLRTWNSLNPTRAVQPEVVQRYSELCMQPLLLLMLVLYDATTGALREDTTFDTAQLYERLLHRFAEREVRKLHAGEPEPRMAGLVEAELTQLSVVALAMFNRLRQTVTQQDLDADLAALGLTTGRRAESEGFRSSLTAGEEVVGRFFFIQRSEALQDGRQLRTYEFLHATFGEYLVARLVVRTVRGNAARAAADDSPLGPATTDEGVLPGLLSYVPLIARGTVLPFISSMLATSKHEEIRSWLIDVLRVAMIRPEPARGRYQPVDKRVDHMMATYSLNLTLLVIACGKPLPASEIFVHAADPAAWFQGAAQQWLAAVPSGMWSAFAETVSIRKTWAGERRDLVLHRAAGLTPIPVDLLWTFPGIGHLADTSQPGVGLGVDSIDQMNSLLQLMGQEGGDVMLHAVEPLAAELPRSLTTFVVHEAGEVESIARSLTRVWLTSSLDGTTADLVEAYHRAVRAVEGRMWDPNEFDPSLVPAIRVVLRLLTADVTRIPAVTLDEWLLRLVTSPYFTQAHVPDALEFLVAASPIVDIRTMAERVVGKHADGTTKWSPADEIRVFRALRELQRCLPDSELDIRREPDQ
ncbi:hypothetical protein AFR_35385 [Actinoplanes friuliensis DSM 7358]|uniref:NACHT N-terminal Helical domain-containing protein n=1 Tax=Actinoplanes friuliensis DSM 7358 TaxID=1246995 RepID=U5W7Y8_9ACTN|nr:hypothetical protein AFR_35385 [Actinoplanes friuliensis DSM 7358]